MSGLEGLGIVSSVLQIIDIGARLSIKLCTFSHKVKNADTNVQNISSDVAMTCIVLRELGETLKKDEKTKLCNGNAVATTERVISECRKIFMDLEKALDKSQCVAEGKGLGTGELERIERGVNLSFTEPQIELLRCNLERLKTTLLLMLNVIIYSGHLRSNEATSVLQEQRELIQTLHEVKKENERKIEDLAKAIEGIAILRDEASRAASPASSVRSISTASLVQQTGEQLESSRNKRALDNGLPRTDPGGSVNLGAPLPDQGELGNYCAVVKTLLQHIEMVQHGIRTEYLRSFRESIIDSHNKITQSLLRQLGPEKVSLAFCQSFADMLGQGDHLHPNTSNDADLASKLAQIGLLPVPQISTKSACPAFGNGISTYASNQKEHTIPSIGSGQHPSTTYLQPPRSLGPQLTLQPPDAQHPQNRFELHSPPPHNDLQDRYQRVETTDVVVGEGRARHLTSPAQSDGGSGRHSPIVPFSESLAPESALEYNPEFSESPGSDTRQRLTLKRDRGPPKNSEGKLYCDHQDCRNNPPVFRRPCEWNKHMDKHDRPYKCMEPECASFQGFTYSGGLLRHQREVHKKNIAAKSNFMCPHAGCNRSTGQGFTRQENLKEHLRRRHPIGIEETAEPADNGIKDLVESGPEPKRRRIDSDVKDNNNIDIKGGTVATQRPLSLEERGPALGSTDETEEKGLETVDELLSYWTNMPRSGF